ncbi:uncharacterized protein IL334_000786 [Kwoniella shivajii]|uniref:tRNA-splicing endonuclease subunit Sen54 N-terminal domain-containing protein n=1 Tax=Kwoniella shivajii TaxID=564305 RepID=A0ABZ1CT59_9TREE|nr:hypothetical protein IL334_000786 [Kwoniella shivajii]
MSLPDRSVEAGPSRVRPSTPKRRVHMVSSSNTPLTPAQDEEGDNPRTDLTCSSSVISAVPGAANGAGPSQGDGEGDEDGDEERMDIKLIQSFADKIQHLPSSSDSTDQTSRSKITIPRRGEKDFEPLSETVNLQEMMLQKSREALFNALVGVRGGHSKAISHAIMTPSNPFPRVKIVHGHLFDTIGMSVRTPTPSTSTSNGEKGKGKSQLQLLPEEALYLLERGTLQIWLSNDLTVEQLENGFGEWSEEEYGIKGAIELSVRDGFAAFIGREGLTWERYQAYAYLKRLGYTVYRSRQFIPSEFLIDSSSTNISKSDVNMNEQFPGEAPFRTWWLNIPGWIKTFLSYIKRNIGGLARKVGNVGLWTDGRFNGTLLNDWKGDTYQSIFKHLRIIPQGHSQSLPLRPKPEATELAYDPLKHNPYLPFYHIWKPSAPFTKRGWDKGSHQGLIDCPPSYYAAVVESRNTPLPTIHQLDEIFNSLPDEPKGPIKKVGPQYIRPPRPPRPSQNSQNQQQGGQNTSSKSTSYLYSFLHTIGLDKYISSPSKDKRPGSQTPYVNIPAIRNGDRAFIVAVNDSGNTGWIRFGRSGFAEFAPI